VRSEGRCTRTQVRSLTERPQNMFPAHAGRAGPAGWRGASNIMLKTQDGYATAASDAVGEAAFATDLRFRLNGEDIVLTDVDPSVLLVDWLRSPAVGLTGTKKSCAQGGCGACTV